MKLEEIKYEEIGDGAAMIFKRENGKVAVTHMVPENDGALATFVLTLALMIRKYDTDFIKLVETKVKEYLKEVPNV